MPFKVVIMSYVRREKQKKKTNDEKRKKNKTDKIKLHALDNIIITVINDDVHDDFLAIPLSSSYLLSHDSFA